MLWVRISIRVRCTTLCDKVCQWLVTGQWFSPGPPVSSTNKTDCHDITEILLKEVLNTIKQTISSDRNLLEVIYIKINFLISILPTTSDRTLLEVISRSTFLNQYSLIRICYTPHNIWQNSIRGHIKINFLISILIKTNMLHSSQHRTEPY
jgi:hypothetical protein